MQSARMNIVLLVVDSLRAQSLSGGDPTAPRTPFLYQLDRETVHFRRAYATECWTLPTHCSMFTGLLPSAHGAHFHSMGYTKTAPTIAEILAAAGFHTEVITRNFVFDGTIPGITRGFATHTQLLSDAGAGNPFALFLALAKPRFRRHLRATGFFHPRQRESRQFLTTFARAMMPADHRSLEYALAQMARCRQQNQPYFLFVNLYDVHAPYPPTPNSILRPFWSCSGLVENLMFPSVMSRLGAHQYLLPKFRISRPGQRMLLNRYHRAIELMDAKLHDFYSAARSAGLLDDTLLIITSDHGEAFGDHGLYLHDASVYDTHLHVPLWIHHPERVPEQIDDVISMRALFEVMRRSGLGEDLENTILSSTHRAQHPIALGEHFHYPHASGMRPCYRQNITAAIGGTRKVIVRREGVLSYDLDRDPDEASAMPSSIEDGVAVWYDQGLPRDTTAAAAEHLRQWQTS